MEQIIANGIGKWLDRKTKLEDLGYTTLRLNIKLQ